jgi:sec-independent protein translocase protein TatC
VLSQLLLAIPMCVLYEVGILVSRLLGKVRPRGDEVKIPEAEEGRGS